MGNKKPKYSKGKHHPKKTKGAMAARADRHALYQKSVQSPEATLEFFIEEYRKTWRRDPVLMREDFCGTAYLSTQWCREDPRRRALGVDLCRDTLDWGIEHNIRPAGDDVAARIELVHADVMSVDQPAADITCAMNFSYNVFKTREQLRAYFESAYRGLADDGMFILDIFGGTESIEELEEERDVDDEDFTYIWDQDKFNPINHHILCHIHFKFADGSKMKNAFTYDWRLWTLPELQELLTEAGFQRVRVFWEEMEDDEDDDEMLEGTGEYYEATEVENQESWVTYVIADKMTGGA